MATFISNIIYQILVLILKRMKNGLLITPGNLDKNYLFGQDRDLCTVALGSSDSPLDKSQFTKEIK